MNVEYVVIRLRAIKKGFIPDEKFEPIVNGKRNSELASLLRESAFREGAEAVSGFFKGKLTADSIFRIVETGRKIIIEKALKIIGFSIPELLEPVFSRLELEQLKYALRTVKASKHFHERRFEIMSLFPKYGDWANRWKSFETEEELLGFLKKQKHPFSPAFGRAKGKPDLMKIEKELELFYFNEYLPSQKKLIGPAWGYFSAQNDLANLNAAFLLSSYPPPNPDVAEFFIPGPGRMEKTDFEKLARLSAEKFPEAASKICSVHLPRKVDEESISAIPRLLHGAFMKRLRSDMLKNPISIMDIVLFLDELSILSSNLKLAAYFGGSNANYNDIKSHFILRRAV